MKNMIGARAHSPDITLIGEAIPKGYEKSQTHKCPSYGEQSHFKRITKKTKLNQREPIPSGRCKRCGKG